jgi:hypothetical protein
MRTTRAAARMAPLPTWYVASLTLRSSIPRQLDWAQSQCVDATPHRSAGLDRRCVGHPALLVRVGGRPPGWLLPRHPRPLVIAPSLCSCSCSS